MKYLVANMELHFSLARCYNSELTFPTKLGKSILSVSLLRNRSVLELVLGGTALSSLSTHFREYAFPSAAALRVCENQMCKAKLN